MRRLITSASIALLLTLGVTSLYAKPEHINEQKIRKLDRTLTAHKAQKRHFRTKEEFKHYRSLQHNRLKHKKRHVTKSIEAHRTGRLHNSRGYHNSRFGYWDDDYRYDDPVHPYRRPLIYGEPHRYSKRGWILAYRYDRADFYDREGFYYGYFNRYGYYFEGEFYRYDRFYTYRDRMRGRGLFDRYYYSPAEWRYYGFCR